jgi:hypothetical protein
MRGCLSNGRASVVRHGVIVVVLQMILGGSGITLPSLAAVTGEGPTGTLSISSEPADAAVYLDGRFVGETPVDVADVTAGEHRVRLVKDGLLENGRIVAVAGGRGSVVRVRLTSRGSMEPAQAGGLKIVVIEGEDAVNIVDKKTAVKPVVEVRDRNDLPVAGAIVTFSIGGKGATFARGAQTLTATTNAAGRAAVTALNPIGSGAVQINVQATFQGQTGAATITQTNFANAAAAARAGRPALSSGGVFPTGPIVWSAVGVAGGVTAWQVSKRFSDQGDADQGCSALFTATTRSVPAAAGTSSYSFEIDCDWTATSDQPWLIFTGPSSGSSISGTITGPNRQPVTLTFSVSANPTGSPRIALITIGQRTSGSITTITITQAGGALAGTFRGTAASTGPVGVDGVECRYSLTLTAITAALSGSVSTIADARVSAKVAAAAMPECRAQLLPLQTHQYVLQSAAISGQSLALTFQPAGSNRPLATLVFRGTVSADNRSISGMLTWQSVDDAGPMGWTLTAPITLTVEP